MPLIFKVIDGKRVERNFTHRQARILWRSGWRYVDPLADPFQGDESNPAEEADQPLPEGEE